MNMQQTIYLPNGWKKEKGKKKKTSFYDVEDHRSGGNAGHLEYQIQFFPLPKEI